MDKMMSHNCDSIEMSDESDNEGFVRDSKEPIFLRRRTYDMKTLAKLRSAFKIILGSLVSSIELAPHLSHRLTVTKVKFKPLGQIPSSNLKT